MRSIAPERGSAASNPKDALQPLLLVSFRKIESSIFRRERNTLIHGSTWTNMVVSLRVFRVLEVGR